MLPLLFTQHNHSPSFHRPKNQELFFCSAYPFSELESIDGARRLPISNKSGSENNSVLHGGCVNGPECLANFIRFHGWQFPKTLLVNAAGGVEASGYLDTILRLGKRESGTFLPSSPNFSSIVARMPSTSPSLSRLFGCLAVYLSSLHILANICNNLYLSCVQTLLG